ncbi:hypothetical protein HaLaN_00264, partial [Haematococcus lacustris]
MASQEELRRASLLVKSVGWTRLTRSCCWGAWQSYGCCCRWVDTTAHLPALLFSEKTGAGWLGGLGMPGTGAGECQLCMY